MIEIEIPIIAAVSISAIPIRAALVIWLCASGCILIASRAPLLAIPSPIPTPIELMPMARAIVPKCRNSAISIMVFLIIL